MTSYNDKAINRDLGRAIHHYDMIADGDRILVGVSGGKDSLTLLWYLQERLRRIPITYELFPVYIDPGFPGGFSHALEDWAEGQGTRITVEYTQNGVFAHSSENLENPCFLCARRRRQRLFEMADSFGCNKIAFGHHKDDIIETLFINICYTGVMGTMRPMQPMFEGRFHIIRPLAFVDEERIKRFAADRKLPEFVNPCPTAHTSKRREVKEWLTVLYGENRKIKNNIFRSMSHVNLEYLL
jgi:tRNA 2-thiocytidine biosynthesis protein TtcA